MKLRAFFIKKASIFHRCLYQANATLSVRTVAETIDYCPDFYHWQANVADALPLLTEKLLCVGVADTYVMVNLSHLFYYIQITKFEQKDEPIIIFLLDFFAF